MFIFVHVFMLSAGENISCVWNAVQSTHCLLISMTEGFVISVYFPSVQQVYDQTENETCLHDLFWHYIIIILISPV